MLIYKRIISFALALVLVAGMLPHGVFAAEVETVSAEETVPAVVESVMETTLPEAATEESAALPAETEQATVPTEILGETAAAKTVEETTVPEETEPEEIYEEVTEVVVADAELPDNAELYDGYLTRMFYGSNVAFFGTNARERLTEVEQKFYDVMKAEILSIAAGERTSTRIEIKKDKLAEWGMTVSFDVSGASTTQEQATIVHNGIFAQVNQRNIINALMYDCPYEMYWYDKTAGTLISSGCSLSGTTGTVTRVIFNFRVAGDMQPSDYNASNPTIETSFVSTAKASAAAAQAIVDKHAALSDYEKLVAYRDEICDLTSYNSAAASNTSYTTDADPWQLIYVFDGDSATTVVCEGYAKAFQYLFDLSTFQGDVSSLIVVGALNGGGHMWNVVSIDGKNYMVDVTNSDSGTAGQNGGLFLAGTSGSVADGYVFLGHTFTYTDNTIELWGEENLTLADSDYTPFIASGTCGASLTWTLDNDGTLEITGSGQMDDYSSDTIPWYDYRTDIRCLEIQNGVTSIGNSAFYNCTGLTEAVIPDSITTIGSYAFYNCTSLNGIAIPYGVTSIEDSSFFCCTSLTAVAIPESVTSIAGYAFYGCSGLTNVTLPERVTSIGSYAFYNCTSLTEVRIPDGVSSLEEGVFGGCVGLKEAVIGAGVNSIGRSAFYGCTGLTGVTIPESVASIKAYAFYDCTGLTEITIPGNVASIGNYAFENCTGLTSAVLEEGITATGNYMFRNCTSLEKIMLPDSLESIGNYAFYSCGALAEILLPESITSVGKYAFKNCALTSVIIPEAVASIGNYAFSGCTTLARVCFVGDAPSIGSSTFSGVTADVSYPADNTTWTEEMRADYGGTLTWISGCTNGHTEVIDAAVAPTCTQSGLSEGKHCCLCGEVLTAQTEIAALGHTEITDPGYAATCLNAGLTEGKHCSVCNEVLVVQTVIDALGHSYDEGVITTEPGCETEGVKTFTCETCGDSYTEAVAAIGHTPDEAVVENKVEPTCTAAGSYDTVVYCYICDAELSRETNTVAALGHTEVIDAAVAPTCTETGLTEGKHCSVCNEILVAQTVVEANGHTEVIDEAVAPTCTETGLTEGKHCSVCNEILVAQTVVEALGHTEVIDAAVAPTCTATGLTEGKHCSVCNETLVAQTVVKANGHTEVIDAAVAPTCTATGLTEGKHCSVCDEVLVAQAVVEALGHTEVIDEAMAPTCTATGLTEGKHCSVCNEVLVAQTVVEAKGHAEVIDEAVAPTCTATGLTEGKHCSVCDEVLVAQAVVEALGHSYDEGVITTEPACETEGVKTFTCETCGDSYTEAVAAIGHTPDEAVVENKVEPTCTAAGSYDTVVYCYICDAELSRETNTVAALGHTEVIDKAVAPTCTVTGLTEGKHCSVCNEILTAQEEIPATGHDYSIGICQVCGDTTKADYELFAAKSLTLKITNPDTGKAYTSKQLTWTLAEEYAPFASVTKAGKLTAKKVVEKTRVEVVGTVKATEEKISYLVDIYPAVTQLEVKQDEKIVNAKTLLMDFTEESITLRADAYPLDTLENVTWTISDAKKQQYADYEIDGNTLTISNPKGKAGIVTIKATINAGVKKTVTVKVQFGSFAKTVEIAEPEKTVIRGGETLTLSAAITDPETVTKPGLVWSVSDKNAATVSNGKVKAKNVAHPTTVTVTATSKDGQASDSIEIEILPKNEGQLVLVQEGVYVTNSTHAMNVGDTYQLSAAVITNGDPVSQDVVWTTSKNAVATVENGLITATGAGTAKITAECNGVKVSMTVKVSTLVADMEISTKDDKNLIQEEEETIVLISSGKSVNLVANVLTAGANKAVTWEITEGSQYAKIATSGKLTANKDLTGVNYVTVKATAKDGSGCSATIRVKLLPLATGVQIYQNGTCVRSNTVFVYDMLQGNTLKLSAKVFPAKANQQVQLTSSNKKIADFVDGELVCYKPGTVTITAKALDGSNAKTTFKLTIVKRVTSLTLKEGSDLTVIGGKSLRLATMVEISPSDATNKKLNWSVAPNDYGIKISTSGVLTTKRVTQSVTVNIMVTTKDGSGKMLSFDVTVNPA